MKKKVYIVWATTTEHGLPYDAMSNFGNRKEADDLKRILEKALDSNPHIEEFSVSVHEVEIERDVKT